MTVFLVDTCLISELARPRPVLSVLRWMDTNFRECVLCSPVVMEIIGGLATIRDDVRRERTTELMHRISDRFPAERRVVFDEPAARAAGHASGQARRAGRPLGVIDAQIIGLAQSLNAAIATRDTDFADRGVDIINPWIET